jgi:thiamine biosynthesis lipoprotein
MDTFFTITVYSDGPETAETAITEAFNEIKKIESGLSVYSEDSELARLNRKKILEAPSEDLKINISRALYYSNLSEGAFDITVQPILDLYNRSFIEKNSAPSGEMINKELKKVDYKRVIIKDQGIKIGDDQSITLGGIAKGYAVEKAVETLRRHNITMALVDASGNMRALGKKPEGVWNVALEDPRDMNNYITIIPLDNNAVSTSGDYERYFDDKMQYHHIINPKTGRSATELISVTIVTDNAFDADALSTAVFVLGKEKGMKLIESLPGVEGLIITREREILRSSGLKEINKK